jgi:hypothetical protein
MKKRIVIRWGRNLCLGAVLAGLLSAIAQTPDTKVQGVLIDKMCSYKAETRVVPGGLLAGGIITIYPHTKQCALMPDCQKSGYGIFTYDQKFLPFDDAGNQKALAYFKQAKQEDDFRVEVIGQIQNDVLKVASITPLP